MLTEPALVRPGNFETEEHFYPRVLNAHIHPLIRNLMDMGNERIASSTRIFFIPLERKRSIKRSRVLCEVMPIPAALLFTVNLTLAKPLTD